MTSHEQIRELVGRALARNGTDFLCSILRGRGGTVLDIGANTGGFIGMWLQNGAEKVHAFEPVPNVFEKLRENWGTDPRVVLNQCGVAEGNYRIQGARILNAHTLANPDSVKLDVALEDTGPFDFNVRSVDAYVNENNIRDLRFVKIDVDGYEPMVVRGMDWTVGCRRPVIMIELSFLPFKLGESVDEMIQYFYDSEYVMTTLTGEVCEDPLLILEAFPWRSSFDMLAMPRDQVRPEWPRIR